VIVTQNKFYSSMSMEKEPAGAFNKAQRLNEQPQRIPHPRLLQGLTEFNGSGARRCGDDATLPSTHHSPTALGGLPSARSGSDFPGDDLQPNMTRGEIRIPSIWERSTAFSNSERMYRNNAFLQNEGVT
jgi:hypothetical protein